MNPKQRRGALKPSQIPNFDVKQMTVYPLATFDELADKLEALAALGIVGCPAPRLIPFPRDCTLSTDQLK